MSKMPRIQEVVLPILRGHNDLEDAISVLPTLPGVSVNTWIPDIDYRHLPLINIRRLGGFRHKRRYDQLSLPVIEMTAYRTEGLIETEQLYEDALDALYLAVQKQTQTDAGYLHSIKETFGATQFDSPFQDSWRIQGLIQLGLRPSNS